MSSICPWTDRLRRIEEGLRGAPEFSRRDVPGLQPLLEDHLNPEHLRAASGCFGLLGVVTHITLEMEPMSYALMKPERKPVAFAIPPPQGMDLDSTPQTKAFADRWRALPDEDKQKHQQEFEEHATNDFYAEWFWFPYCDDVWVNC